MRAYVPCSPARDANVPREAEMLPPRSGHPLRSIHCGVLPHPASRATSAKSAKCLTQSRTANGQWGNVPENRLQNIDYFAFRRFIS